MSGCELERTGLRQELGHDYICYYVLQKSLSGPRVEAGSWVFWGKTPEVTAGLICIWEARLFQTAQLIQGAIPPRVFLAS